MAKYNGANEIIKHRYFKDMEEGDGYSLKTVDAVRNAINRYELFTDYACLKKADTNSFIAFKQSLLSGKNAKGMPLSLSTIEHTLAPLRKFFIWLRKEGGYKKSLKAADTRYLRLKMEDRRKIQTVQKFKEFPSIEDVKRALNFNPKSDVEMRDRAIIATLACTAMRHESIITVKVGHLDIKREAIIQNPQTMRTKNSKWINSKLIDLDESIKQIVLDWGRYLKEELHFTDNDPLFPKEQIQHDEYKQFIGGVALSRNHIKSHEPVARIIKRVFENAGLKYNNPHSFRDMQTHHFVKNYGVQEIAALSLNLGHENIAISLGNYYKPTPEQQFDILENIGKPKESVVSDTKEILAQMQQMRELLLNRDDSYNPKK